MVNGLSSNLKDISTAIWVHDSSISFKELSEKLIEHESFIYMIYSLSDGILVIAHAATKTKTSFSLGQKGTWTSRNSSAPILLSPISYPSRSQIVPALTKANVNFVTSKVT